MRPSDILQALLRNDYLTFYIPVSSTQEAVCAQLDSSSVSRWIPYNSISIDFDQAFYNDLFCASRAFVERLRSGSVKNSLEDPLLPRAEDIRGLTIRLVDTLATAVRGMLQWKMLYPDSMPKVISTDPEVTTVYEAAFSYVDAYKVELIRRWSAPTQIAYLRTLSEFKGRVDVGMIISNIKDRQYNRTNLNVLAQLLGKGLHCLCAGQLAGFDRNLMAEHGLYRRKIFDRLALYDWIESATLDRQYVSRAARFLLMDCIHEWANFDIPHSLKPALPLMMFSLHRSLYGILASIVGAREAAARAVDSVELITVAPGRSIFASACVSQANARDIPTIELQAGTLSATNRFVRPNAEEIFAIDPLSIKIYSEFFGVPADACTLVGSPNIDQELSASRMLSRHRSRRKAFGSRRRKTVSFATQPAGTEVMARLIHIIVEAALTMPDVQFGIKQHPGESQSYGRKYEEIIQNNAATNVHVLKNAELGPVLMGSDVVVTYYSTVGLSAFALDRPVICLNPFQTRPPFDLVAIGVAIEAGNAVELCSRLAETLKRKTSAVPGGWDGAELKDGRSAARIADHICDRLIARQGGVPPERTALPLRF